MFPKKQSLVAERGCIGQFPGVKKQMSYPSSVSLPWMNKGLTNGNTLTHILMAVDITTSSSLLAKD